MTRACTGRGGRAAACPSPAPHPTPTPHPTCPLQVHGWSGSQHYFDLNTRPLASQGLTVYTYDQRFHGESDKPSWVGVVLCVGWVGMWGGM